MSRLDYSKWDKFDYDSSDDESNQGRRQPTVTRLDDGATIHIGPSGSSITSSGGSGQSPDVVTQSPVVPVVSQVEEVEDEEEFENEEEERQWERESEAAGPPPACSAGVPVSKASGTIYRTSHTPDGGGFPITYKWKQSRNEVYLWVSIASSLKASALKVEYDPKSNFLRISTNGFDILSGELKYKIEYSEDDGIDWEITEAPRMNEDSNNSTTHKAVQITFQKHVYTPGSVVWWSAVFSSDDSIDVSQIPERMRTQKLVSTKNPEGDKVTNISSTESFAEAWKTAHAMFTEKVKEKEPIEVYDDDDEQVDDIDVMTTNEEHHESVFNISGGSSVGEGVGATTPSNMPAEWIKEL